MQKEIVIYNNNNNIIFDFALMFTELKLYTVVQSEKDYVTG